MVKKIILTCILLLGIVVCAPIALAENVGGDANTTSNLNQTNTSQTYYITIDAIGNHTINDVFFLKGTTNLQSSENLFISIAPRWGGVTPAGGDGSFFGLVTVPVQQGENGVNFWSCNITPTLWITFHGHNLPTHDIKSFMPDDFIAIVSSNHFSNVSAFSQFTISPEEAKKTTTISLSLNQTIENLTLNQTTEIPILNRTNEIPIPPSPTPLSPALVLLAVVGIVILNVICRKIQR